MENDNIKFTTEELQYFDNKYFNDLINFLKINTNKSEVDYIKLELKNIEAREIENKRIYNFSDNDLYNYLISRETEYNFRNYKKLLEESEDKEEAKKLIYNNHLNFEREYHAPSTKPNKKKEFYKQKLEIIYRQTNQKNNDNKVYWKGTNLQFSELIKALIESKLISPELNQKEIFSILRDAFNIDYFNENDRLKEVRNRTKDKTKLINLLEDNLNKWITKKD